MKNQNDDFNASRRSLLRKGMAAAAVGAVAASGVLKFAPARAQSAKASKAVAMYQDKPHGTQQCDNCIHFVPGKTATAAGTCKVVEGAIAPRGWCVLYAAKS